jgi:hypothetical protein
VEDQIFPQEQELEVVLGHKLQRSFRISPIANPNSLQKQILEDWTRIQL